MHKQSWFRLIAVSLLCSASMASLSAEKRCGWLNIEADYLSLTDAKATWIFSLQGGDDIAASAENVPMLDDKEFVKTFGSYGYGCACLMVTTNHDDKAPEIVQIHKGGKKLPLNKCQNDKTLPPRELPQ